MQTEKLTAHAKPIIEQARAVGEEVNQLGRVTRDEATEGLTLVKETATGLLDRTKSQANQLEQRAESAIRSRPFRAMAIAAAVGAGVGLLAAAATLRR